MPTAARSARHREPSRERLRPPRLRAATRARAAEMPTEISAAPVSYSRSLQPVCTASHRRNPPTLGSQPTSASRAHGWVMRGPPPPTAATTAAAVAMVPRHQARWWQAQPWRPRRSYLRGCRWRGRRCSSCSRSAGPAHRVRCGECGGEEDSTRDPHNLPRTTCWQKRHSAALGQSGSADRRASAAQTPARTAPLEEVRRRKARPEGGWRRDTKKRAPRATGALLPVQVEVVTLLVDYLRDLGDTGYAAFAAMMVTFQVPCPAGCAAPRVAPRLHLLPARIAC